MQFRVRWLVPVVVLATIAGVFVPVRGAAQQAGVCDQAIAEAGTGQGTYGRYTLVQAPAVGRSGSQVVVGTAGPDRLVGGSGDDVLCGLGGDDVLLGGSGNDYLDGGDGADELQGDSGNDALDGAAGFDRLFGGSGDDTLRNGEVNVGGSGSNEVTPVDISARMPRVRRDEITGDLFGDAGGLGYDQIMRAENDQLLIHDPPSRGGRRVRGVPMDLVIPSSAQLCPPDPPPGTPPCGGGITINTWSEWSDPQTRDCDGCFANYWRTFDLATIYLAHNGSNLFMSGTTGSTIGGNGDDPYHNVVYVLEPFGSCARSSCADAVINLPTLVDTRSPGGSGEARSISVTSLAAGHVGQTPYLAVGLTDGGVQIYDVSNQSSPRLTATFTGMAVGGASQTPPTALAWDPSGSGLLAIGLISRGNLGFVVRVNADGSLPGSWVKWSEQGTTSLTTGVLSAAFGQRGDGSPVVAFGMTDGTLRLIDPNAHGTTDTLAQSQPVHGIIAINPIPRFDASTGGTDFAVSYQTTSATPGPMLGNGGLLRWNHNSRGLFELPVSAGSTPTLTADWDSFRAWYPGIKEGRLQVKNTSREEPITVTLHTKPDSASGCWYAPSWADAPAFPTTGFSMGFGGSTSDIYTMGAYTAGDGTCAATNNTDIWRGYLVITPVNHPADARLVRLRLNADMTVDVENQAGGPMAVSIQNIVGGEPPLSPKQLGGAFGLWQVTVDMPAPPTPLSPPTVTGHRVTPAATPGPAVYRFDVTGGSYQLPMPYPNQIVVPPLLVQGSTNGTDWTDLGTLVPPTAPTIVNSSTTAELTLGPATFWWENPAGATTVYTDIRVAVAVPPFGSTGPASEKVTLAGLTPPAATNSTGPEISAPGTGTAAPVNSGVDQAPLQVKVLGANNEPLSPTSAEYQSNFLRIYYRNGTAASDPLITNLFLAGVDPSTFIGVSPCPGAYPNNGSVTGGQCGPSDVFHYVSTTSTIDHTVQGWLANAGAPTPSQPIDVHASAILPVSNTTSAASGIMLIDDSTRSALRLAPITNTTTGVTPAMYLDSSSGVQIGVLTAAVATTAQSTLPLQHPNGTDPHLLVSAPLTVSDSAATLTDTSAFQQGDRVDTNLVTRGVFVPVNDVLVQ